MDPLDFLKVSDKLKNSAQEALRRTAVSRAYYSVYHCIRDYLVANRIISTKYHLAHEKLVTYLKYSGIEKVKELSQRVDELKTDRQEADYNMNSTRFNEKTCILLFCKAKDAIQEFQNCKGHPLIEGINKYKQCINE